MMATTHALVAVAVASLFAFTNPESASVALVGAFAGGVFPDLDLYFGHRKTLHFPTYYWPVVAVSGLLVFVGSSPFTVGLFFFTLGAALHSTMDIFGGGLELRPWEAGSERAVYDHFRNRWHRPRRWIRYDGAPEDAVVATAVAVPSLVVADGSVELLVVGAMLVSLTYALVRRKIPLLAGLALKCVPAPLYGYVPERFIEG